MDGLTFETAPYTASAPDRSDVALFAGFVRRRGDSAAGLPAAIRGWLREQGYTDSRYARPAAQVDALLDVPVPVDSWDVFDRLFAWEERPLSSDGRHRCPSYLGAAIQSFFAQGGRKCYVVRVGDPFAAEESYEQRRGRVEQVIPGFTAGQWDASPLDPRTWSGAGHLLGLPEVSFLCLPDLPDLFRAERAALPLEVPYLPSLEQFVECSEVELPPGPDSATRSFFAPRCDEQGYADWTQAVHLIGRALSLQRRDVQFIAALPLPHPAAAHSLPRLVAGLLARPLDDSYQGIASAFVQLAYPWLRTRGSELLPEKIEGPDAVLAGLLARNALSRGTFRSAARRPLVDVFDVFPPLRREDRQAVLVSASNPVERRLVERVSLFDFTPGGLTLLSDVTTSPDEAYRPAALNRLMSLIVRAARRAGEASVFEPSNELLWQRLRGRLSALMLDLLALGALRGASPGDAFSVRCDRSTMSQNDLDSGRVICEISFTPAAPIEQITVVLALDAGGLVSLLPAVRAEGV